MVEIPQWLVNMTLGGMIGVMGWWSRTLWDEQKTLRQIHDKAYADLKALELHMVTTFVPHSRFDETIKALFTKLDRIEDKIDEKMDKA